MKNLLLVALLAILVACARTPAREPLNVETNRLQSHIEFLASDSLRGRDTGTRGSAFPYFL